jgi:hypothetical protein
MSVLRTKIGDSAFALNRRGAAFWPNYGNSDIWGYWFVSRSPRPLNAGNSTVAGSSKCRKTSAAPLGGAVSLAAMPGEWLSLCGHSGADLDGAGAAGGHRPATTGARHHRFHRSGQPFPNSAILIPIFFRSSLSSFARAK